MEAMHNKILYLSREEVIEACSKIDPVTIMRETFKLHSCGQTVLPDEAFLTWTNLQGEDVRSLNMPGYVGGSIDLAGTKIINSNPHNLQRGLPRASGVTLLFDKTSVRILSIMEGAYLSSLRTASVTMLAVDLLKSCEIEFIAIIGAGVLARAHIELLANRNHYLRKIFLFDINPNHTKELQQVLHPLLEDKGILLQITSTVEDAIRNANLIIPTTTTTSGYIRYEWLMQGSLLVNVSLDDPLPEVILKANKVIVDDWNLVKNDTRRLIGRMYREGLIFGPDSPLDRMPTGTRRIDAQLGEIVTGAKTGREAITDIVIVNPFGLSIEDIALAASVYRVALNLQLGVYLEI